jgi:serine/threonine protein kinase
MEIEGFRDLVRMGSGGLGDVYRGVRVSTGASVAIKVLRDWSDESAAWHRAQRELRALVDLQGHPHVVHIEEVIEVNRLPHLVMEYAAGGSLTDLLRERGHALSMPEVVLVAEQTASALAASHNLGIVHLDIKPQNLLIGSFGQVKVCDFGIAALTRTEQFKERTSAVSFRYASPEQLNDEPIVGPPPTSTRSAAHSSTYSPDLHVKYSATPRSPANH